MNVRDEGSKDVLSFCVILIKEEVVLNVSGVRYQSMLAGSLGQVLNVEDMLYFFSQADLFIRFKGII